MTHIHLTEANTYLDVARSGIGANSLDLTVGARFLKETAGVVDLAGAGDRIVGVNVTQDTYTSDNQTVALKKVTYVPTECNRIYDVAITGGTITVADETKYYDLSDSFTVDGTTESTTTGQLELVKFVSATNSKFKIVNL